MSDNLMDTREAAEYLGVTIALVGRYCRQGRLKAKKVGQQWVITRADLERFAQIPRPVGKPPGREDDK